MVYKILINSEILLIVKNYFLLYLDERTYNVLTGRLIQVLLKTLDELHEIARIKVIYICFAFVEIKYVLRIGRFCVVQLDTVCKMRALLTFF